jgi:putative flavoprotein involved in K+ transport
VVWATGYRPAYPWLRVPAFDRHGQIAHRRGVTSVPGLYVLGLKFLYRRDSTYVDGVRHDARFVAAHVTRRMTARALPAASGLCA